MNKNYFGIIDIGSNTIRLVIYSQAKGGRLREVQNVKAVARLRSHLDQSQTLSDKGINILLSTLKSFKTVISTYQLESLVCVATATIRQANNQATIKQQVEEEIGFTMKILTEQEEAYYGYLAVVHSTTITDGITIDIGGGSTELTYFKDREVVETHSFPFGTITLKEFFQHEVPTKNELKSLRHFVREQFDTLPWVKDKSVPLVAIGGSARNVVQIDQHRNNYPFAGLHQYQMAGEDIATISDELSQLNLEQLKKVDGLSNDRADIILPAIEVFDCLFQKIDATSFVLSRKGLRDGIFYEQLAQHLGTDLLPNVLTDSIQELINDYDLNTTNIDYAQGLSQKLLQSLKSQNEGNFTPEDQQLLEQASNVFNLGDYIDSESSAQHTFYLLANRTIDGLFHSDRLKLALVASYKSKSVFHQFLQPVDNWFTKQEQQKLRLLGAIIKFGYSLNTTKRQIVQDLAIRSNEQSVKVSIYCREDWMPEQYQAEKQKKHIEKELNKNIELTFAETNKQESS